MSDRSGIISLVAERQDLDQFRRKNWEGTFDEYLDIVRDHPEVTRNAFQRLYDMILSHGTETYEDKREARPLQVLRRSGRRRPATPSSASTSR